MRRFGKTFLIPGRYPLHPLEFKGYRYCKGRSKPRPAVPVTLSSTPMNFLHVRDVTSSPIVNEEKVAHPGQKSWAFCQAVLWNYTTQ